MSATLKVCLYMSILLKYVLTPSALSMLDLRWNNIGVIGGRALLSALTRNHTLLTLSVEGSNVPKDMVEAIGIVLHYEL